MCDKAHNEREIQRCRSMQESETPSGRRLQHSEDVEKLKSLVRLCVMRILTERLSKPAMFSEMDNALVTELIVEYLDWMGYTQTLDTFHMECRLPKKRNSVVSDELPEHLRPTKENILPRIFRVVKSFKEN